MYGDRKVTRVLESAGLVVVRRCEDFVWLVVPPKASEVGHHP